MHHSSLENMQKCYERFIKTHEWKGTETIHVVDIGGANVNGTYSDIFSGSEFNYTSVDINPGDNIDVVLDNPYKLPFPDNSIDIVISGQVFEHVEFFWLLFDEFVRTVSNDGLIILIAPSAGPIHNYSVDCYRFYPDAYRALAKYSNCRVLNITHDERGPWKDLVGVFSKNSILKAPSSDTKRNWETNRFESEIVNSHISDFSSSKNSLDGHKGQRSYMYVLRRLHKKFQPETYVEIGIQDGKSLMLAGNGAIGIDPVIDPETIPDFQCYSETSDDFFEHYANEVFKDNKVDLAFIDGMHLFEFALRDFMNVEKYSSPETIIVIDDVLPNNLIQGQRKRDSRVWAGDVWKIYYCLKEKRKDLGLFLLNTRPTGTLVVTGLNANNRILTEQYNPIIQKFKNMELTNDYRDEVLHRILAIEPDKVEFWQWLNRFVSRVKSSSEGKKISTGRQLIKKWQQQNITK